jgi:hypothetical protein
MALVPQYWPSMASLSGIAAIACAIVAAVAYFVRPSSEFLESDVDTDLQGYANAGALAETATHPITVLEPKLPEPTYDLYGGMTKDKDYEKAIIRWLLIDPSSEQQREVARRVWTRKLASLDKVKRTGFGSSVYIVSPDNKVRRKVPRSQSGVIEPPTNQYISRALH